MSSSYCAFDHRDWDAAGLEDYGDFSDMVEYVNQREDGYDSLRGEWFYIPDEPMPNGDRVIYWGTFGNYNSPGASSYTHAEVYEVDDEDEKRKFDTDVELWHSMPEYLEQENDYSEHD